MCYVPDNREIKNRRKDMKVVRKVCLHDFENGIVIGHQGYPYKKNYKEAKRCCKCNIVKLFKVKKI